MSFSENHGYKTPRETLQVDSFDPETTTKLWNVVYVFFHFVCGKPFDSDIYDRKCVLDGIFKEIVTEIALLPIDTFTGLYSYQKSDVCPFFTFHPQAFQSLRNWWREEFLFPQQMEILQLLCQRDEGVREDIKKLFKKLSVGYKITSKNEIVQIVSDEELESIEQANEKTSHIDKAMKQLKNGDFQNSIKEAIVGAEDASNKFLGDSAKGALGENLKEIGKKCNHHPAFLGAMDKLYGFSSDEKGIRHSGNTQSDIGQEEALYVIITCSAFINYLTAKGANND